MKTYRNCSAWAAWGGILALTSGSPAVAGAYDDSAPSVAQTGKVLRIDFPMDNPLLMGVDPFQTFWTEHRAILSNVVESLTTQDPETGVVRPGLAESWTVSEDGLRYEFTLRSGVTFSNGEPFDAAAVKTAFDSDKAEAADLPTAFGATYLSGYDHADILDPHRIRIVLVHPNGGFLQAVSTTALGILAPQSYALSAKQRASGDIIGTGPFVLRNYAPAVSVRLEKRKGYAWGSPVVVNRNEAQIDAVDIRFVPEQSVRNGQFVQGSIDIAWPRNPFSDPELKFLAHAKASFFSRSLPGAALNLYPNTEPGALLADPVLRQAIQKSIDRASYAHTVYSATFPQVRGLLDVSTPFFKSEEGKLTYDPAGAARLLDADGWRTGSDGYRYKDGKRLKLILLLATRATEGDDLLQDQLRHAGIDIELKVGTTGEWLTWLSQGKYDLASLYLTGGDPDILQNFLDPRRVGKNSLAARVYPADIVQRVEKLFDEGAVTAAPEGRARAYGALQDLMISENLAFPLAERLWQVALSPRVHGFSWSGEAAARLTDVSLTP